MTDRKTPRQQSFVDFEYAAKTRTTRRERFLALIESLTPWSALVAELEPHYPKGGKRGRPPMGLEKMLRMYIAQQCFGLSDEGTEDALYDSLAVRRFVGLDLSREVVPDATTLLRFRRLLEQHGLTKRIFETINGHLADHGLLLREGTVVDATLISAPSSTKNQEKARDPEMHQTKKGNQWFFGMNAHIGVDADTGVVHTLETTAANVSDVVMADALLHGDEVVAFGDAGYQGADKRCGRRHPGVSWEVAMRPGIRRQLPDTPLGRLSARLERFKASVRAKVEHPFHRVKNLFGLKKVRYRGLAKNTAQLFMLFALGNLLTTRRRLVG